MVMFATLPHTQVVEKKLTKPIQQLVPPLPPPLKYTYTMMLFGSTFSCVFYSACWVFTSSLNQRSLAPFVTPHSQQQWYKWGQKVQQSNSLSHSYSLVHTHTHLHSHQALTEPVVVVLYCVA